MFLKSSETLKKVIISLTATLCLPLVSLAETAAPAAAAPAMGKYQLMRYVLLGMAVLLLFIIMVMGNAVASAGKIYWEREKKKSRTDTAGKMLPLLFLSLLYSGISRAQEADALPVKTGPVIPYDIYLFVVIVALEFTVIMVLAFMLLKFLRVQAAETLPAKAEKRFSAKQLFQKLNQTVALEEEHKLDLQHDYDGIRELDNKVPGWWRYAFYASILFGVVYLYRMFIAETLPTQFAELREANAIAAIEKEAYLKNAANNVDENTVTMLDASGIADGAALFSKNCQACHGDKGQGGVGPNLTDEYWLHQGSLKDIFHSIKYGWPEKGMKSWKDDFSPAQIAQLASYIKSINGTKPAGAKDPQGTVYIETKTIAEPGQAATKL